MWPNLTSIGNTILPQQETANILYNIIIYYRPFIKQIYEAKSLEIKEI